LSAAIGKYFCGCWVWGCELVGIGEGCDEDVFNKLDWEETCGSCSTFGNDGFDNGAGADGFVLLIWEVDFVLLVVEDSGEMGFWGVEVAAELLAVDGAFEERARTWFKIFELACATFGGEDLVEEFVGTGSTSEADCGGVARGDGDSVLAATVGALVLPTFFWACVDVTEAPSVAAIGSVAALLDVVADGRSEAFVDFCRVPFLTASTILSAAIDSDTTFFGLPLFFITSSDICCVVAHRLRVFLTWRVRRRSQNKFSRVTRVWRDVQILVGLQPRKTDHWLLKSVWHQWPPSSLMETGAQKTELIH
jgi:hypothetical protein